MRVLLINKLYYPWIGGVEKVVQDIAESLKDKIALEVLVCNSKGGGEICNIGGVKVNRASSLGIFFSMPISFSFPYTLKVLSRKFDILHFHLPFPLSDLSYLFFCKKDKKVIVTYHSDIVRQRFFLTFYRPFLLYFFNLVDIIVATSPNLIEHSKILIHFKDKCRVIPPCISEDFNVGEEEFTLNVPKPRVLFVGRLCYYKGLDYLIEALLYTPANLIIVGSGDYLRPLQKLAYKLKVHNRVHFLGNLSVSKLKYCYKESDMLVLPSCEVSEAFGLVQLEAMAWGKPVINTDIASGVPYVSRHGETGLTVPPKDPYALAQAINTLINDKHLYEKFAKNAKIRVQKFFREKMANAYLDLYKECMSEKFGTR